MADKILVVRNDKLGDFMLSWPAFAILKQSLPDVSIHALVPEYTREMAQVCPWIDDVVLDPGPQCNALELARILKPVRYSAMIALFSTLRVGLAACASRIPVRVAPATKLAQAFYTHRLKQRRSRSEKPEHEYNADLARHYLRVGGHEVNNNIRPPYLRFSHDEVNRLRVGFVTTHDIPRNHKLVFLHAGSGGSARNLSKQQFQRLSDQLDSTNGHCVVVCAGPGEDEAAADMASGLKTSAHVIFRSQHGLLNYARHIAFADLFISGSTGPLHMAGALNRPTAAFYPKRRSATALRWRTLNEDSKRLTFRPPDSAGEEDMAAIDRDEAARVINRTFLR
ncbi:MAG: glycosyltransferase family 9 protein [Gammaproteobacteria bacterium]